MCIRLRYSRKQGRECRWENPQGGGSAADSVAAPAIFSKRFRSIVYGGRAQQDALPAQPILAGKVTGLHRRCPLLEVIFRKFQAVPPIWLGIGCKFQQPHPVWKRNEEQFRKPSPTWAENKDTFGSHAPCEWVTRKHSSQQVISARDEES